MASSTASEIDLRPAMSVKKVAEILGVSKETIYRMCREGEIDSNKVRSRITITPAQLEAYRLHQFRNQLAWPDLS